MRFVFADTQWWVATANPADAYARLAAGMTRTLSDATLVTTDEVIVEALGSLCGKGEFQRRRASRLMRTLLASPRVRVLPQSRETLLRGLDLFDDRPDKGYSLVDCISMEAMKELKIAEVLTADRHFEQEGFVALMRP
ncbi:MAG: type II toxin-antitoxin system VapC family toxin [Tepidiformaceae bacterium]